MREEGRRRVGEEEANKKREGDRKASEALETRAKRREEVLISVLSEAERAVAGLEASIDEKVNKILLQALMARRSVEAETPFQAAAPASPLARAGNLPLPSLPHSAPFHPFASPIQCGRGGEEGMARNVFGGGLGWGAGWRGWRSGTCRQCWEVKRGGALSGPMHVLGGRSLGWNKYLQPQWSRQGVQQRQGKGKRERWQGVLAGVGGGEAWAEVAEVDLRLAQWLLGKAPSVPPVPAAVRSPVPVSLCQRKPWYAVAPLLSAPRLPRLRTCQTHHAGRAVLAPGSRHSPLRLRCAPPVAPTASPHTAWYRARQVQHQWQVW
ncbi:unnamed protein product [Closterium sp. NIES-65]|nr:unnamed protein product [Closterium sp. NIES-65]